MATISDANFKTFGDDITLYPGQRVVKIGNRMLPVGIGNNAMPATVFYKCSAVYGPREVEAVVISGCPIEWMNGGYLPTEFTTSDWEGNPQPVYKHITNGSFYYYEPDNYMSWGLGADYSGNMVYTGSIGGSWSKVENYETVEGMSAANGTATVDTDIPKTWDGYKAVLADGVYSFKDTLTTGLTYSVIKPEIGTVYSTDALIEVKKLYDGSDLTMVFYAPLSEEKAKAETGQNLTVSGTVTYGEIGGIPCVSLINGSYISISPTDNLPTGNADRTLACWAKTSSNSSERYGLIGCGMDSRDKAFYMEMRNNTVAVCGAQSASNESYGTKTVDISQWHHYALVYSSGTVSFYIDGESCGTFTYQYNTDNSQALIGIISDRSTGGGEKQIARAKIYNRALSSTEIAELADEFQI